MSETGGAFSVQSRMPRPRPGPQKKAAPNLNPNDAARSGAGEQRADAHDRESRQLLSSQGKTLFKVRRTRRAAEVFAIWAPASTIRFAAR